MPWQIILLINSIISSVYFENIFIFFPNIVIKHFLWIYFVFIKNKWKCHKICLTIHPFWWNRAYFPGCLLYEFLCDIFSCSFELIIFSIGFFFCLRISLATMKQHWPKRKLEKKGLIDLHFLLLFNHWKNIRTGT